MVPTAELPLGMPFTLQLTLVFEVLATAALKFWLLPSKTDAVAGVTVTVMAGGGGGGSILPAPPPQPIIQRVELHSVRNGRAGRGLLPLPARL